MTRGSGQHVEFCLEEDLLKQGCGHWSWIHGVQGGLGRSQSSKMEKTEALSQCVPETSGLRAGEGLERFATKFAKKRKSERKEMCSVRTYKTYSDIC